MNRHFLFLILILGLLALSPLMLNAQGSFPIYFGDFHCHTWYSDGSQDKDTNTYKKPVAQAITYARSSPSMNFLGVSEHNHNEGGLHMTLGYWRAGNQEADSVNQDGVFVGMFGQEWGTISGGGHVLIYGTNKLFGWNPGVYDVYVAKSNYTVLFDSVKKYNGFCYLAHPDQSDFSGIFTGAYNSAWDSVVMGVAMRSGPASSSNTTETDPSSADYTNRYHDLLRLGYHVAPCAHQDNHNTTFGRVNQQRTGVLASSLTRAGVLDALRNRRTFATEDHNLKLRLEVGTHQMGEIFTMSGPVTLRVSGIDPDGEHLSRIELRYGVPGSGVAPTVLTFSTNQDSLTFVQDQTAGSTYYYYAYVAQIDGQKAWSAPVWITTSTSPPPAMATLLSPANGATNQTLSPVLRWSKPTTATSYRVQLATDSTFGSGIVLDDASVVDTTRAITSLAYGTRYFWRVDARNSGGSSGFTLAWSFTTQPLVTYTINATAGSHGTISPAGAVLVTSGATQTFLVTPATGYHTDSVIVDGVRVDSTGSYTFRNVVANHTIRAAFAVNLYTITAVAGSGGAIAPSGSTIVAYNGGQAYTITPNTGYHIVDVVVDGSSIGAVTSYGFTNVAANHTISASFAVNTYALTATAGAGGSITPGGVTSVNYGGNQNYVITPATGYRVSDILVDGVSVGPALSYSFTNVTANHTINASFALNGFLFLTKIKVRDTGAGLDSLELGVAAGATDGMDPAFGEYELPPLPPTGIFDIRWAIPGMQGMVRDVRDTLGGTHLQSVFTMKMQAGEAGYPLTIHWKIPELPAGVLTMRDGPAASRFSVNMKQQDSLVISDDGIVQCQIVFSPENIVSGNVQSGWNIVSVPVTVSDRRKAAVFPGSASSAFSYGPTGYVTRDTLQYGIGYWLKFSSTQNISLTGSAIASDTVDVVQGWNMIGSISTLVPVGNVVQLPGGIVVSSYFGYGATGYTPATSIVPMQGYWVKASQSGRLVLH
jgi:hypothetical protein